MRENKEMCVRGALRLKVAGIITGIALALVPHSNNKTKITWKISFKTQWLCHSSAIVEI